MSTGWTVLAAAAAVALAGTVRTWIVAFSVPYGHPPQPVCPNCQNAVIPAGRMGLLGWLPPNGRCRTCGERIGPPPGTVEALLAVAAGALVHTSTVPVAAPVLVFLAAAGVTLAFVDLAARRLPDPFTAAAFAAAAVVILLQMLTGGGWSHGLRAATAAGITGGCYFLLTLIANGGMGDVKLGLTTGLLLGAQSWTAVLIGGLASVLITAVIGSTLRAAGRRKPGDDIAHGPSMLAGVVITLVTLA
ncbi:prepilin peptidase [Micromonospora tulbaghiae]